ncbi:MAG TPA: hypothetical protein GX740_03080, partial [Acholeplasmataceae bacterium]|nr:hypothetical protein [Acholeplasmataceae bacterium]
MDLKTIELEILKINEEFITYLDEANLDAEDNVNEVIQELKNKVDEKSTFIKSLESKLIGLDNDYQEKLNNFQNELETILKETKEVKFDLEKAKVELEKQKEEELKPFLQALKKQRSEITSKITSLKKELSFLQKENKNKLTEEEKNFKNREIEYTRRMDIDLTRASDANIKQYSELEKSILETEDVRKIREVQKKINSIRLVGIKENLEIKNKYAVLNYENQLAYKKFLEKVELDNQVLTEEFKQRMRNLEYELELLDLEEEEKIALLDLNNELKLREFERENELDLCKFEEEKANKYTNLHKELLDVMTVDNKEKFSSLTEINSEMKEFYLDQLTSHIEGNQYQVDLKQTIINKLLENLRQYIESFKDLLVVVYSDYINKRKILIEEYLKQLNQQMTKFNNLVKIMVRNLDSQIKASISAIKEFWNETDQANKKLYNKLSNALNSGFKNKELEAHTKFRQVETEIKTAHIKDQEEYNKKLNVINKKTKKIVNDFNIKKKDI